MVTKDIPDGMIVAGVPAKIIKSVDDYYEKAKNIGTDCKNEWERKETIYWAEIGDN